MPSKHISIRLLISSIYCLASLGAYAADEKVDLALINKIRDEGMNRSQVMQTLSTLTDEIGPRLTGSPGLRKAGEWTKAQLTEMGMQNAHTESFAPFGKSWSIEKSSIRMLTPAKAELIAIPRAWTGSTDGIKRAKVVYAKFENEEDLAKWKGKLNGVVLLRTPPAPTKPQMKADASRYTEKELADIAAHDLIDPKNDEPAPNRPPFNAAAAAKAGEFSKKLLPYFIEEKVLATVFASYSHDGTVFVQEGGSFKNDAPPYTFASVVMAAENYNRLYRLVNSKKEVELELDVQVNFSQEDPANSINVFADFPGSDKKEEVVMLGGHLDSWHGGTGATDNGAGVAVAMEAMRILKAVGFKPRRTIRIGLWGGEEQGLLGSKDFIKKYVAEFNEPKKDAKINEKQDEKDTPALKLKPLHNKISAYFNLDNGYGKIRGIYTENNLQVQPIFDAWLAPFRDLGATTSTMKNTDGTDHEAFEDVGVPGFQFIQDPMDYDSRTHHSNMDVFDKVQKGDMMQAAIIMASFVAHAANRDEMLPRKPLPKESTRGN
ncbi:MAG: M20/M25/M40 family metallo-hydrolase [Undibacterium sp.]|nr:M20/M25/M40 family metallo-hydrolase [Undibacterium sp.]